MFSLSASTLTRSDTLWGMLRESTPSRLAWTSDAPKDRIDGNVKADVPFSLLTSLEPALWVRRQVLESEPVDDPDVLRAMEPLPAFLRTTGRRFGLSLPVLQGRDWPTGISPWAPRNKTSTLARMAAAERWFAALTSLVALRGENGHAPELSGPNPD